MVCIKSCNSKNLSLVNTLVTKPSLLLPDSTVIPINVQCRVCTHTKAHMHQLTRTRARGRMVVHTNYERMMTSTSQNQIPNRTSCKNYEICCFFGKTGVAMQNHKLGIHNHLFNMHPEKWFQGYPVKSTQVFIRCYLFSRWVASTQILFSGWSPNLFLIYKYETQLFSSCHPERRNRKKLPYKISDSALEKSWLGATLEISRCRLNGWLTTFKQKVLPKLLWNTSQLIWLIY